MQPLRNQSSARAVFGFVNRDTVGGARRRLLRAACTERDIAVPVVEPLHATQGIVFGDLAECLGFEQAAPVRDSPVQYAGAAVGIGFDQRARDVRRLAGEIDALDRGEAARVPVPDRLADQVALLGVGQVDPVIWQQRLSAIAIVE